MAKEIQFEGQICPHCASHLILKEGRFGEFLACPEFPRCQFTKPLPNGEMNIYYPSPYCDRCNHTGLLPFRKDDKVIPNAYLHCECKQELDDQVQKSQTRKDNLIDFPCSAAWVTYYASQRMTPDFPPDYYYPSQKFNELDERIDKLQGASQQEDLNMLRGEVAYLRHRISELGKPKPTQKQRRPSEGVAL